MRGALASLKFSSLGLWAIQRIWPEVKGSQLVSYHLLGPVFLCGFPQWSSPGLPPGRITIGCGLWLRHCWQRHWGSGWPVPAPGLLLLGWGFCAAAWSWGLGILGRTKRGSRAELGGYAHPEICHQLESLQRLHGLIINHLPASYSLLLFTKTFIYSNFLEPHKYTIPWVYSPSLFYR